MSDRRVLAIGEVKSGRRMGLRDLHRLERVRELLRRRTDVDASGTRLLCFSAAGFDQEVSRARRRAGRPRAAVRGRVSRLGAAPAVDQRPARAR